MVFLVSCAWGEWSAYTGCTTTCGGGKQYRFRTILQHDENGGTACVGTENVDEQVCNSGACPTAGIYLSLFVNSSKNVSNVL